jgi:hypothetical protein
MAAGLPIVGALDPDHELAALLAGHPLAISVSHLDAGDVARVFRDVARLAVESSADDRTATPSYAAAYEETTQLRPAALALALAHGPAPR